MLFKLKQITFKLSFIDVNVALQFTQGIGGGVGWVAVGGGGGSVNPPCGFSKNVSSKGRVKPWLFVTFNIIIIHRKYEEFICQYYLYSLIFIDLLDFLTFPCYKEANDVSL